MIIASESTQLHALEPFELRYVPMKMQRPHAMGQIGSRWCSWASLNSWSGDGKKNSIKTRWSSDFIQKGRVIQESNPAELHIQMSVREIFMKI